MHVPRSRNLRFIRRSHMDVLPLSKIVGARGLSILRILSKQPPIGVMQQTHVDEMTGPILQSIILVYYSNG